MSNSIHDIILLSGGISSLAKLEIQPPGQPLMVIERVGDDNVRVTIGGTLTAYLFTVTAKTRFHLIPACAWPPSIDAFVRKRGYVEAAIKHRLTPA